jgi:GLPGLI family protein
MSKNIVFIIFILSFGKLDLLFSQSNKVLRITYIKEVETFIDTSNIKANKVRVSNFNSIILENSKNLSYDLIISDYHSIFRENKSLASDHYNDRLRKLAGSFGGTKGIFYINKKDSIFLNKKQYAGENFRVKLEVKNWQITNESKHINNYLCYKAVSIDKVANSKGNFKFNVTAWFCPELPSYFGPAGYFGLPGLILELNNGKVILKAKEISLEKSLKEKVKPLKKGVLIPQEEYNQLVKNTARDLLKSSLKN